MSIRPVVHAVRCTYPQCQATNGCVGVCSKTAPVAKTTTTEWVGLTDDEIWDVFVKYDSLQYAAFARAVEAKVKEKNCATAPVSK
jgi:hypothetical protein